MEIWVIFVVFSECRQRNGEGGEEGVPWGVGGGGHG